jgi:phosphoribosylglycinamide formyltransferase-1
LADRPLAESSIVSDISAPRTPPIVEPPIRLAVCASGGGTTLQNLLDRIDGGRLMARVVHLVASKPGIGAIEKARRAGVPTSVVERAGRSLADFSADVFAPIRAAAADLVILGGFLQLVAIPDDYRHRVLNIHPSLIPSFCGKGFHGQAVHRAALEMGVKLTGCTVHFADDTYDTGPIVVQRAVPVLDDDTPETLAARVFAAECDALPEAIALYAAGRLRLDGRRVRVVYG